MPGSVAGVASEKEVVMIQSRDTKGLLALLNDFAVPGKQLHVIASGSEQDGLSVVISKENLHQETSLRKTLDTIGSPVHWNDSIGTVSIVGAGINTSHQKVLRGSAALEAINISVLGIATSSFRTTWLIDRSKIDEAMRLLHQFFIESNDPLVP